MKVESKERTQREEKLLLLYEVVLELVSATELSIVLKKIIETATIITKAEASALFLLGEDNKSLYLRATKSFGKEKAEILYKNVTDKLAPTTIERKDPLMLSREEVESVTDHSIRSFLCIPLNSKEKEEGVLCVYNCHSEKKFTPDDEDMLSILAKCAATTIKNTILMGHASINAETFENLYNVSKEMLSEVDLQKLLGIIVDTALKVLDADIVILYEYIKERDDVKMPPIFMGRNIKFPEIIETRGTSHKESIVFKLLKMDKPFYASNAIADWNTIYSNGSNKNEREGRFIHKEGIVSSAGIPLRIDDEPVGLLFINFRTHRPFRKDRKIRIETFATEAALAIRNARIFTQRNRSINELSVLNTISQEISSGVTLSTHAILNLIYEQTGRLMDVTNFFVAFYHKETNIVSFEFAVEKGERQKVGEGQWASREAGNGLTEYVIRKTKTLRLPDDIYKWMDEHGVDAIYKWMNEHGVEPIGTPAQSWLGTRLTFQDEVLGVIVIQNSEKENAYDKRDEEILETIASQAAIAIAKARLFQESQNQLAELNGLYKISQEIVSKATDIMDVLKTILEKAVEISNADSGEIIFYDDSTGKTKIVLTHKLEPLEGITMEKEEGMAGQVISKGKAMFTDDYFNSSYKASKLDKPEFRSLFKGVVQVPLKWQDEFLGVLALSSSPTSNRVFTEKDVERLNHFAGPASIAIAIARNISFRRSMLYDNPDAIIAIDKKGWITEFNKSSERIMGFKKEDVIEKKHVTEMYYGGETEAKRINRILIESEAKGEPVKNVRTAVRGCTGEYIPILFSGVILRNELGERIGSIGLMNALKEIEQLDEEYRTQQHFLAEIEQYPQDTPIDTHDDLQKRMADILKMTLDFCHLEYIILFSSTAEDDTVLRAVAWSGVSSDVLKELPHFNWRKAGILSEGKITESTLREEVELINKWTPDGKWKETIRSGIRGNNAGFFSNLSCGVPVRLADNYRAVLIFGPFKNKPDLLGIESFIRNVAQTININALSWLQALYLRANSKEADRSKRLIVHRTRMQLQQIIGKFGLIKDNSKGETALKKEATEGERLVEHLSNILTRAITSHIAEMEPADFHFQPFPLPALIQNCVEGFKERAYYWKRGLEVDPDVEFLPYAEIDPLMLSVALGNLIENALKYSYENTSVRIYSEYDKKEAKIIVEDYGEEMSDNARQNLFRPGMRWGMTPRARELPGTGFGLWDSSVIANAHGGKLEFTSGYFETHSKKKNMYLVDRSCNTIAIISI
jgi:PAS domain S-box-containing protein